jgi:hypothetical protein
MNGKCSCIAAFFLLQKSKMLQYVNNGGRFARFACRATASSNNGINQDWQIRCAPLSAGYAERTAQLNIGYAVCR